MAHDIVELSRERRARTVARRHRITVCSTCRNRESREQPGAALAVALEQELAGAGLEAFDVSVVACMAGCDRPCAVAYQAEGKASYLFGDISPARDMEALLAFARQYLELADGWCSSIQRPEGLKGKTVARMPALAALPEERS